MKSSEATWKQVNQEILSVLTEVSKNVENI